MTDCPNADVRDLLPELAAGTLSSEVRTSVESHLAECAECRAELALLEAIRKVYARPAAVDVGRIAAAIPTAESVTASTVPLSARSRPSRAGHRGSARAAKWPLAAAIAILAVGGASFWALQSGPGRSEGVDSIGTAIVDADQRAVTLGHRLGDLSEQDLEALMGALDGIDALPALDPAPIIAPLGGGEGS